MDNDARMKEMESLLQQASHFIPETDEPFWHRRARTILTPPPDPDALAKEIHNIGIKIEHPSPYVASAGDIWSAWEQSSQHHLRQMRAIAAWIEADRVTTWNAALDEAQRYIAGHGRGDKVDLQWLRKQPGDAA